MDREEQLEQKIITVGERWQTRVAALRNQRTAGQKWLRFTAAVQQRHQGATARTQLAAVIVERQQPQRLAASDWPPAGSWPATTPLLPGVQDFGDPAQPTPSPIAVTAEMADPAPEPAAPPRRSAAAELRVWSATPAARAKSARLNQATARLVAARPAPGGVATLAHTEGEPAASQAGAQSAWPAAGPRLPARTQQLLEQALNMRLPGVQLHVGVAADAVARRLQADAVTLGDHIFFRAGKYDPGSAAGIGLLGHELTHIAQNRLAEAGLRGPQPWARRLAQEEVALQNEQQIIAHLTGPPAVATLSGPGDGVPVVPANSRGSLAIAPTALPQTAESNRNVSAPAPSLGEQALSPRQLQQIKDAVYRDLLDRIRTEFERGG